MRFLALALALLSLAAAPALATDCVADVQGNSCSADLQYSSVQSVQSVQSYAPVQQVRVIQRVVQPQAVYVQPQAVVLRQRAHVQQQVIQQRIVSPYVQQNLAIRSHGVQQLNSRQGGQRLSLNLNLGQQRSQRVVTKSRTVTSTGSGGLIGRLLGR